MSTTHEVTIGNRIWTIDTISERRAMPSGGEYMQVALHDQKGRQGRVTAWIQDDDTILCAGSSALGSLTGTQLAPLATLIQSLTA